LIQKCVVHPTLIRAATGGKIIAKIDKRILPRKSPMINKNKNEL
jgi:hypothetical protein